MFQHRHMETIAATLRSLRPFDHSLQGGRLSPAFVTWAATVRAFANTIAADNARFDRARFYRASGLTAAEDSMETV